MTTGDHRIGSRKWTVVKEEESPKEIYEIEITHREKKRLQNMLDKKKRIRREFKTKKPSVWRFFLENNKASVLTALGLHVQKSMEQDTGSGMIPRFLKAVREIYFLICGS